MKVRAHGIQWKISSKCRGVLKLALKGLTIFAKNLPYRYLTRPKIPLWRKCMWKIKSKMIWKNWKAISKLTIKTLEPHLCCCYCLLEQISCLNLVFFDLEQIDNVFPMEYFLFFRFLMIVFVCWPDSGNW